MTKFAILGDQHFGVRGNSEVFHKLQETFLTNQFFPYLEKYGINNVLQAGDLFDVRKNISPYTLTESKRYFFDVMENAKINFITLLGNHDLFYRETLKVNTPEQVLGEYTNINIINKAKTITIDDTTIDMIPWICKENSDEIFQFIANSKSDLNIGHYEIANFAMYKGIEGKHGLDPVIFEKYELVMSGHYHTRSRKSNIVYVGIPYEMTWQDHNDPKGFHVFDTISRELTFIENEYTIYKKFIYDDVSETPQSTIFQKFHDKIVKIIVHNKKDQAQFDTFIKNVYDSKPIDVKIVEDYSEFNRGDIQEDIKLADTVDIIYKYIDSVDNVTHKENVKDYMKLIYNEAIHIEGL